MRVILLYVSNIPYLLSSSPGCKGISSPIASPRINRCLPGEDDPDCLLIKSIPFLVNWTPPFIKVLIAIVPKISSLTKFLNSCKSVWPPVNFWGKFSRTHCLIAWFLRFSLSKVLSSKTTSSINSFTYESIIDSIWAEWASNWFFTSSENSTLRVSASQTCLASSNLWSTVSEGLTGSWDIKDLLSGCS